MNFFKLLSERVHSMNSFSRRAAGLGLGLMACVYITALFAYVMAPRVPNYLQAMTIYYGAMEVAPACLAAGICAAIICDIIFHDHKPGNPDDGDNQNGNS